MNATVNNPVLLWNSIVIVISYVKSLTLKLEIYVAGFWLAGQRHADLRTPRARRSSQAGVNLAKHAT